MESRGGNVVSDDVYPDRCDLFVDGFFPKSLNRTQDRHWSHRHKAKRSTVNLLYVYFHKKFGGVPVFSGPVKLTITRMWGRGQRALDRVNLYGAAKVLEDSMRSRKVYGNNVHGGLGVFEDDDEKHCDLVVKQMRNYVMGFEDVESTNICIEGRFSHWSKFDLGFLGGGE